MRLILMLKLFLISLLRTRGIVHGLVSVMWLGEGVGSSISMVWSKSESIYPAFDQAGECAELECVVKLVDNQEGTYPSEP